jgi:5-methylcytosine-specific restriction endonuclease McrA
MKARTLIQKIISDASHQFAGHGLTDEDRKTVISYLEGYCKRNNITPFQFKQESGIKNKFKKSKSKKSSKLKKLSKSEEYRQIYLMGDVWKKQRSLVRKLNKEKNNGIARCEGCGLSEITTVLDVHHSIYRKTEMEDSTCVSNKHLLCRACHNRVHKMVCKEIGLKKATQIVIDTKPAKTV